MVKDSVKHQKTAHLHAQNTHETKEQNVPLPWWQANGTALTPSEAQRLRQWNWSHVPAWAWHEGLMKGMSEDTLW